MFPKRGALAAVLTVGLLVFLLNFRTPDMTDPSAGSGGQPVDQANQVAVVDPSYAVGIVILPSDSPDSTVGGAASAGLSAEPSAPAGSTSGASGTPAAGATDRRSPVAAPTAGGTHAPVGGPTPTRAPAGGSTSAPMPPPAPPTAAPTPGPTRAPTPAPTPVPPAGFTGAINGAVVSTKYGPMQVRVVYSSGRITDVVTLQETNSSQHSIDISNAACPLLRSEALSAQSASIATVSGATYTSKGYKQSLQSAINAKP